MTSQDNKIKRTWKCPVCGRMFHPLGSMRHRAMHRDNAKAKTVSNVNVPEKVFSLNGRQMIDAGPKIQLHVMIDGNPHTMYDREITDLICRLIKDKITDSKSVQVDLNIPPIINDDTMNGSLFKL